MGVLIVDDEAELADAIATYLQAFGFEAEYVVDGASALAAFDARPPKLVVLDVNLPDVNGFEVCRAMRAKATYRSCSCRIGAATTTRSLPWGSGVTIPCASLVVKRFRGSNAAGIPGSGLGLYTSAWLAERMGGELTLANADGCAGFVAQLTLPLA